VGAGRGFVAGSPIAWHNYLVLLGPGVLLLLARGRAGAAFLLLALQCIPAQWPLIWNDRGPWRRPWR
jgi:hypothetical protein